ncbi:MAG TPA: oxygenase MpaB family protein [Solirubrobacteraceae bacterium]|nr:oxygenase MpaB family protein [Solirubrobacteraceae bacterium]
MTTTVFPSSAEADAILLGPDSVAWQRASDVRLYLVMAYALLLQVAHPTVGAGVRDYSDFERRPWSRLLRTIDYVTLLVYGGPRAIPAGRRLRELHRGFRGVREDGRRYHALEPDAYAWVHATLIDAYVTGHAHFGTPMTAEETERFYSEYRRLGRLIGVRERDLPPTWSAFRDYFERMSTEELAGNESVDRVLRAIRRVPPPPGAVPELLWRAVRIPAADALRLGGVGPMAPELRARLGIAWSWRDELRLRALGAASRTLGPVLPTRLRVTGPAQLRWREQAIARGPLGSPSEPG